MHAGRRQQIKRTGDLNVVSRIFSEFYDRTILKLAENSTIYFIFHVL